MESQSIHPGVEGGKRRHPLENTCANSSLAKRLSRQIAGIEKHLEQHPHDAMSQARLSKIKSMIAA